MKQNNLFEEKNTWKAIASMAVPAVITMLIMTAYNMADMFFVARTGDTAQVAAISIVGSVFTFLMAGATMIGTGGSTVIARMYGRQDSEGVHRASSVCLIISIGLGILSGVFLLLFQKPVLVMLGTDDLTYPYALKYMRILALGAPFMILATSFANIIRGAGAVKVSMIGNMIATLVNLILDPLFILYFHQGVSGAAVATVLGNIVGTLFFLYYCTRMNRTLSFVPVSFKENGALAKEIAVTGLPSSLPNLLMTFRSALVNNFLRGYGTDIIACAGAAGKATMIVSMIIMGICVGTQPLVAYTCGKRDRARTIEINNRLLIITTLIGTVLGLACYIKADMLSGMFLKDEAVLSICSQFIRIHAFSGPLFGVINVTTAYLQANRKPGIATVLSVLSRSVLLVPLMYLLQPAAGLYSVPAGQVLANVLSAVICAVILVRNLRKPEDTEETAEAAA